MINSAVFKKYFLIKKYSGISETAQFKFPSIVVIGPQGAGKSSVLESIVQQNFLPRGENMITKCPIIINLQQMRDGRPFVKFKGSDEKIYNFNIVQKMIINKMNELTNDSFIISDTAIEIFVYLNEAIHLTLIDLPGFIKNPTKKQPKDLEYQIKRLVEKYIKDEECIILAIINSNTDLATSESLKIAAEADPDRIRTVGVITKLDLQEQNETIFEYLQNRVIYLRLGYIGVINQSSKNLDKENISNNKFSDLNEKKYYENSIFRKLIPEIGTGFLVKKLCKIFLKKVEKFVPELKKRLKSKLNENKLLFKTNLNEKQLIIGHINRINMLFKEICLKPKEYNFLLDLEEELKTIFEINIGDLEGLDINIFYSKELFYHLVLSQLEYFHLEMIDKINKVYLNLVKKIITIKNKFLFEKTLNKKVIKLLKKKNKNLINSMDLFHEIQKNHLNLKHPDFVPDKILETLILEEKGYKNSNLLSKIFNCLTLNKFIINLKRPNNNRNPMTIKLVKEATINYLEIMKKSYFDFGLKSAVYFLKSKAIRKINNFGFIENLIAELSKNNDLFRMNKKAEKKKRKIEKENEIILKALKDL